MTLVSGLMIFFVVWWIVLFMVLPFGVRPEETPQKGFEPGAPKNPHLRKKFIVTTVLAALIWGIIEFIMVNHFVTFS
jgi:predicted secreted protein